MTDPVALLSDVAEFWNCSINDTIQLDLVKKLFIDARY